MTRHALLKILEAFFRRWILYCVPFVALTLFGIVSSSSTSGDFTSSGAVFIDRNSFVADRTGVGDGNFASFLTPAQAASQELNGLLGTDVFIESLLEGTISDTEISRESPFWDDVLRSTRRSIRTFPSSENLLRVVVTRDDAETAQVLATATIEEFVDFKISLDVAFSSAAESFFSDLALEYAAEVTEASAALDAYLREIDAPTAELLTPEQQTEFDRLTASEQLATGRYLGALDDLEASRLAELQAETDVRQSIFVVDPPQFPLNRSSGLTDQVVTVAMFALLGVVTMVVGPVVGAMLDRGITFSQDLDQLRGAGVIAVVPRVGNRRLRLSNVEIPTQSSGPTEPGELSSNEQQDGNDDDLTSDHQAAESTTRWIRA